VNVSGVEFGSVLSDSLARVLAGIPVGSTKAISYLDVLQSLRGLGVKVQFKDSKLGPIEGTLLEVSSLAPVTNSEVVEGEEAAPQPKAAGSDLESFALTILETNGALRRMTTPEVDAIHPLDPAVSERLGLAASTLAKRAAQLERGLRIEATAQGPIRIGYMAETPVWRASYRLVLGKADAAVLQGWALVHNDTDEAWRGISLQLINGRPDSFLFPLAAPRYARRKLAEPSETLSTAPQLSRSTADQMWGDYVEPDPEEYEGSTLSGYGSGGGGSGMGIGLGTIGTIGRGAGASGEYTTASDAISIGNLADIVPAAGEEGLTLYSYDLGEKVNVRAHGSALVPFLGDPLEVKRITWFGANSSDGRSASIVRNSTQKTLPPGVLAVYEADGFAGETSLDRLKPSERQLLQFGYDLDVTLETQSLELTEHTKLLDFRGRKLGRHYLRERRVRYTIGNRGGLPRTIHVSLGLDDNARVEGADALDYHAGSGGAAAVFDAAAGSKREVVLTLTEAIEQVVSLASVEPETLDKFIADTHVPSEQRAVLVKARQLLGPLQALRDQARQLRVARSELQARQKRLHEHERELGDEGETPSEFVTRLLQLEDEVTKADGKLSELDKSIAAAEAALAEPLELLNPKP
jgi:hypothetical protein